MVVVVMVVVSVLAGGRTGLRQLKEWQELTWVMYVK
jgi:hypothetical protein